MLRRQFELRADKIWIVGHFARAGFVTNHAENNGDEKECRDCCDQQAADDRAAERRVLLAAFAEAERHRQHADDHGERGHQHRAQPRVTGVESRRRARSCPRCSCSFAKVTIRMLFAVATPMLMIAPISDGHVERGVREEQHPHDAGERAGQRGDDDERIESRTGSSRPSGNR